MRIADWAHGAALQLNGLDAGVDLIPGNFAMIGRVWSRQDEFELNLPMESTLVEGHPRIEEIRHQVAIKRGPVVYCLESADLPEGTSITDGYRPGNAPQEVEYRPDSLGGVVRSSRQTFGFVATAGRACIARSGDLRALFCREQSRPCRNVRIRASNLGVKS